MRETKPLPEISKRAFQLQFTENARLVNELATHALAREGLLGGEWKVDLDRMEAFREVPEKDESKDTPLDLVP